jgi:hypothetical protein
MNSTSEANFERAIENTRIDPARIDGYSAGCAGTIRSQSLLPGSIADLQ